MNEGAHIYLGYLLILEVATLLVYLTVNGYWQSDEEFDLIDLPFPGPLIAIWGAVGALGLWIWMFSNFFASPPERFRLVWGWGLFFGTYPAAIAYFFVVYLPRAKNAQQQQEM